MGMIWQIALIVVPMYVVTWRLGRAAIALAVVASTSLILKFTWYDHLKELEHINQLRASSRVSARSKLDRQIARTEIGGNDTR